MSQTDLGDGLLYREGIDVDAVGQIMAQADAGQGLPIGQQ